MLKLALIVFLLSFNDSFIKAKTILKRNKVFYEQNFDLNPLNNETLTTGDFLSLNQEFNFLFPASIKIYEKYVYNLDDVTELELTDKTSIALCEDEMEVEKDKYFCFKDDIDNYVCEKSDAGFQPCNFGNFLLIRSSRDTYQSIVTSKKLQLNFGSTYIFSFFHVTHKSKCDKFSVVISIVSDEALSQIVYDSNIIINSKLDRWNERSVCFKNSFKLPVLINIKVEKSCQDATAFFALDNLKIEELSSSVTCNLDFELMPETTSTITTTTAKSTTKEESTSTKESTTVTTTTHRSSSAASKESTSDSMTTYRFSSTTKKPTITVSYDDDEMPFASTVIIILFSLIALCAFLSILIFSFWIYCKNIIKKSIKNTLGMRV